MTKRNRKNSNQKLLYLLTYFLIAGFLCSCLLPASAAAKSETATLRVISTGDLHGQLTTTNYDSAGEHTGSLAQAHTLIKQARKEIKNGTSITVDVGDTIYGYGSDFVVANDGIEYMYQAMAQVGYDAITLGNHDFDYGYTHVKKQLKKAGLSDECVLSNVYSVETGETVWNENKIITKKLKTSSGRTISLKTGIIGVTVPYLSTYANHTGILATKDMVDSVKEQIKKLKAKGSDIILVLAHGSMGDTSYKKNTEKAIYAISQIDGVDAIMFGHPHVNFPSEDNNVSSYYDLPGVSKKTGLVNGIPVVSVKDHGTAIGIADLLLSVSPSGKVSVKSSQAKLSYVENTTASSRDITKYKNLYEAEIKENYERVIASLEDSASITNYFGLLSDNRALELTNEAKIQLGLSYIHNDAPQYRDYPVIAASNYKKYGKESPWDYINISKHITVGDTLNIQSYNHEYASLYWITGKQLREWLEYCASAYENAGYSEKWPDNTINHYVQNQAYQPVLSSAWTGNWSNFSIFDGIEYEIDASLPPRYNIYGERISYGYSRIKNLTCNGKAVTDDMKFVLVSDGITASKPVIGAQLAKQRIKKTSINSSILLKDYILEQAEFGPISGNADNNWHIDFPAYDYYMIRSSFLSAAEAQKQPWYRNTLESTENHIYYQAAFQPNSFQDLYGPTLVLSPDITVATNRNVTVMVQANDASGLAVCKYAKGYYEAEDSIWNNSDTLFSGNSFVVGSNGIYSVMAMDTRGNKTVQHIHISNINTDILQVPSIAKYTNRKSQITGTGEPGATVHFYCKTGSYQTLVSSDGTFSYPLPAQEAGSVVKVSLSDSTGRESEVVEVPVIRTGPNYPEVNSLTNKNSQITGDLKDTTSQIFAIIGSRVYVAENGGERAYRASSRYESSKKIIGTAFSTYGTEFSLSIPVQKAGTVVRVYAVDKIGRTNQLTKLVAEDVAPNQPVIFEACDAENHVFGYVPNASGSYDINVTVNGQSYPVTTDSNGYFAVKTGNLKENATISATASDILEEKKRTSAKGTCKVASYKKFIAEEDYSDISLSPVTEKDPQIIGSLSAPADRIYLKTNGKCYTTPVNPDGSFALEPSDGLVPGKNIYAVYRDVKGDIIETQRLTIALALPEAPQLLTETIYNNTSRLSVFCTDQCTAAVKINGKIYTTANAVFDEALNGYLYQINIEPVKAGSKAYVFMENATGRSSRRTAVVAAKIPEISDLNKITTKTEKITGTVSLILPETSPETPSVENTETVVYAKIKEKGKKDKLYKAKIKADGSFKIVLDSKPEKDSDIVIWAKNAYGGKGKKTIISL